MGRSSPDYTPKSPAQGALYQVVRDHFETFRAEAARIFERDALPRFIEEEFRGFLRCGFLAGGFARFHCGRCGLDRLVPFSCKGRAVCPSCGGRRMAERAAHLVDDVFPTVPVRQWVLSLLIVLIVLVKGRLQPADLPTAVWINPPAKKTTAQSEQSCPRNSVAGVGRSACNSAVSL